ncbi:hypothetical protein OF897_03660 [Chryseobacterium formosus]|uniref:Rod shape-determining protein MreD n=1 Tax=Chryseobacterium formosus TaxID=1537363 RepID=A0ABT3XPG5_9FLAO|nr:hypothetical protein [Chryseobacterium formosus]MCX8523017.1 hypothetical protein [Chryseobacterium formosus]
MIIFIKYLNIFSVIAYSFIMLIGQMIPIPFIIWLSFTVFDFGNIDQLFAFSGLVGMILNLVKSKYEILFSLLSVALMITAVASRLMYVFAEALNYPAFTIPFFTFIITQALLIILKMRIKNP